MQESGGVVAFVEVFEDGGEDLGDFFGEGDALGRRFEEAGFESCVEEGGGEEDGFVGCEEAAGGADGEGYDG